MNTEQQKRFALIKSLVKEQGADGDKLWLIDRLETAEVLLQEAAWLLDNVPDELATGEEDKAWTKRYFDWTSTLSPQAP